MKISSKEALITLLKKAKLRVTDHRLAVLNIVSKSKHNTAKRERRLVKAGYGTKKGKFGYVLLKGRKSRKSRKGTKKMRGGMYALSPSSYDGQGVGTSGNAVQVRAGMGN